MASTLLLKLIADDDAPFPAEFQENNRKILMMHFLLLKRGTTNFDSVVMVAAALNYLSGFIKAGLIDVDISEEHSKAASAVAMMTNNKSSYKLTEEGAKDVEVALELWLDIASQSSAKLIREIQHQVDTVSHHAKKVKQRQKLRKGQSSKHK